MRKDRKNIQMILLEMKNISEVKKNEKIKELINLNMYKYKLYKINIKGKDNF